ncbi:MAG: Mor transcription activator family protein [Candidatus Competibacteraceae bacterium]
MLEIPQHYPQILADIAQLLRSLLNEHLPNALADTMAISQVELLSRTYSGCQVYFPKQKALKRHQRDEALYREFTGNNHTDLARRYCLTVSHVYEIVKRVRKARPFATESRLSAQIASA